LVVDPTRHAEAILQPRVEVRQRVDDLVDQALAAGGLPVHPRDDQTCVYGSPPGESAVHANVLPPASQLMLLTRPTRLPSGSVNCASEIDVPGIVIGGDATVQPPPYAHCKQNGEQTADQKVCNLNPPQVAETEHADRMPSQIETRACKRLEQREPDE
jgi:hypothetical protein